MLEVPAGRVDGSGDIHIFGNPHYWLEPKNVRAMAQAVCDKLRVVDAA